MSGRKTGSVNTSEKDFLVVSHFALEAWEKGDKKNAIVLDELARRINRAITIASAFRFGPTNAPPGTGLHIESPLEAAGLR